MNIAIIDGNYFSQAFVQLGYKVYTVGSTPNYDWCVTHPFTAATFSKHLASVGFEPDILFYGDCGNLPYLFDPQNLPYLNIWYTIDTYCNPWHIAYGHGFDLTLVAQKDFLQLFTAEGQNAFWLPLFCQTSLANQEFDLERDIPVSFVGNVGHKNNPERGPFLERFRKIHPLFRYCGNFVPIFARSQIALNQLAFGEVNFRCFEAAACGAALLTETCANGLDELFEIGVEILPTYTRNDASMAARIAREALAKPLELKQIALAGHKAVLERHTDQARVKWLDAKIQSLVASSAKSLRLEKELGRRTISVASAFGVIAAESADENICNLYGRIFKQAIE